MITQLWIRLDTHDTNIIQTLINKYSPRKYAYCLENKQNGTPHCHILIFTQVQRQTIRKYISSIFQKRTEYAITRNVGQSREDTVQLLAYCHKEDTNPTIVGFDPLLVQQSIDVNNDVKRNIKRRKLRIVERILFDNNYSKDNIPNKYKLLEAIMSDYDERGAVYDARLIEKAFHTAMCTISPDYRRKFQEHLVYEILSKVDI